MDNTQKSACAQSYRAASLAYHRYPSPGKIEIVPTKSFNTQHDLGLAYSPGVACPALEIEKDAARAYDYTDKGNLVAVISNGTSVLGLGNIGALSAKPVMEGKALLFKVFAGINGFDIEIDAPDVDTFTNTVTAISPTFGGINLEDIKSPECFEIEARLKAALDIPVMHDDQHGTAVITGAALINALEIQQKDIADVRIVVNGAGAAAMVCTDMFMSLGARPENIVMCDSRGVIRPDRADLAGHKARFARDVPYSTLAAAMHNADVFVGLSVANVVTAAMLRSMAARPVVFALANPDPEIAYDIARAARNDLIFATGRSDYPNQVNNVLGFPYIFRGALDTRATDINEAMKIAAVHAIARVARYDVPASVRAAYPTRGDMGFGPEHIIPTPFDPRLLTEVAPAVARAAAESGVARRPISDYDSYAASLAKLRPRQQRLRARYLKFRL